MSTAVPGRRKGPDSRGELGREVPDHDLLDRPRQCHGEIGADGRHQFAPGILTITPRSTLPAAAAAAAAAEAPVPEAGVSPPRAPRRAR